MLDPTFDILQFNFSAVAYLKPFKEVPGKMSGNIERVIMISADSFACFVFVLCGSPKPDLPEHTQGLLIYGPSILRHAPENRVRTLKA